jgi:hypothetical protein
VSNREAIAIDNDGRLLPSVGRHTSRLVLAAATLALIACDSGDRYAIVEVQASPDVGAVTALHVVTATGGDGHAADLTAGGAALAWPRTFSVEMTPSIPNAQVAVFARDAQGHTIAVGDAAIVPGTTAVLMLAPPRSGCQAAMSCCTLELCDDGRQCGHPMQPCCDGFVCPAAGAACLNGLCAALP